MDETTLLEGVGKNGGVIYSDGNGYWYRVKDKRHSTAWRLSCAKRNCKGTGRLAFPSRKVIHLNSHACENNTLLASVTELRRKIMKRCCEEVTPLSRIFFEETTRSNVDPNIAAQITFQKMESSMYKARRKSGCPPLPTSIWGYVDEAQINAEKFLHVHGQSFFSGVVGEGDEAAVIFFPRQLDEILVSSEEWHMDGTFKCVPKHPQFKQLFTIIAIHNNHALPIVFCLMTAKTASLYEKIFFHLQEQIPNLQPKTIISDYEAAIKAAVSLVFPNSKLVGCWFHYAQCVYRKVQKVGLAATYKNNTVANKTVQMIIALALLPEDKMDEGMGCIEAYFEIQAIMIDERDKFRMAKLFRYIKDYWIIKVGSQSFSVFNQLTRTNNCQESFHNRLNNLAGSIAHPNIWSFQGCLVNLAREAVTDVLRLESNQALRRSKKIKWLLQDATIREAERKLMADPPQLNTYQYLSLLAYKCTTRQPLSGSSDEDEGDDDLVALENNIRPPALENAPMNEEGYAVEERRIAVAQQKETLQSIEINCNDVESANEAMACITCCTMTRSYAFEPCGHFSLCGRCCVAHREAQGNAFVTCVVCGVHISGYKHIFFN